MLLAIIDKISPLVGLILKQVPKTGKIEAYNKLMSKIANYKIADLTAKVQTQGRMSLDKKKTSFSSHKPLNGNLANRQLNINMKLGITANEKQTIQGLLNALKLVELNSRIRKERKN